MNIQLYHKLIENPALLNEDTLKDIEDLVRNFPMVENFRILLTLNLLILNDYRYDNALTNAAIYSSDRKKLKEWIDYILISLKEASNETEVANADNEAIEEKVIETSDEAEDTVVEMEEKTETVSEIIENTPKKDKPVKKEVFKEAIEQEEKFELDKLELEKKKIRSKKELLKLVRKRLQEIETEKAKAEELQIEEDEKTIHAKLIDRFIEQKPSISRPDKNEFFDPQSEAVESSIDDDFFVTETLAQIHTQQGNLKKAEEIYRKLILKNPEKSSYFAAQIEKLTKK